LGYSTASSRRTRILTPVVGRNYWSGKMPGQTELLERIRRPPIPPDGNPGESMHDAAGLRAEGILGRLQRHTE
jgi:hypothetical protein